MPSTASFISPSTLFINFLQYLIYFMLNFSSILYYQQIWQVYFKLGLDRCSQTLWREISSNFQSTPFQLQGRARKCTRHPNCDPNSNVIVANGDGVGKNKTVSAVGMPELDDVKVRTDQLETEAAIYNDHKLFPMMMAVTVAANSLGNSTILNSPEWLELAQLVQNGILFSLASWKTFENGVDHICGRYRWHFMVFSSMTLVGTNSPR